MSTKELSNYRLLKRKAQAQGARLFGVADIRELKAEIGLPSKVVMQLPRAIALGSGLIQAILETLEDAPNKIYYHHYRVLNQILDQIAFNLANLIQNQGFKALPIPASQIVDWQKQSAHLSHKKIGLLAGLGWLGRNNLLVNPKLGCQFRLVTILTDMPLRVDKPIKASCGKCRLCISSCPAAAIKQEPQDFDYQACFGKLKEFQKSGVVGQYICGICVKACPGRGFKRTS